jgi:hypothetical protein
MNYVKVLEGAGRAKQAIELAMDLNSGPDYERAVRCGFTFAPVVPVSLDIDNYRRYICSSRGEFTVAKDLYARTRSGWFSGLLPGSGRARDNAEHRVREIRTCGRGSHGLCPDDAVEAIKEVNRDFTRHSRAACTIAVEYFDALKLLDEMAEVIGL